MNVIQKPYTGMNDQSRMTALAIETSHENLHVIDLPYRFSSWAFDHPENVALWEDENGQLIGWAALQTPFWAIDYVVHTDAALWGLHQTVLAWADQRAKHLANSSMGRPAWFINVFPEQLERITDLEKLGFACQSDVGENSWSKVFMARQTEDVLLATPLPAGFSIRPLADDEVEAYVALHQAVFQSKNMTSEWRTRTRQHPEHQTVLDLVVESPERQLIAFCVCWFTLHQTGEVDGAPSRHPSGQIEPMGVHEDLRGQGLGRALLREGVKRLHDLGASHVFVETDNYRDAAFALYESVGFRVVKHVLVYRKDYS